MLPGSSAGDRRALLDAELTELVLPAKELCLAASVEGRAGPRPQHRGDPGHPGAGGPLCRILGSGENAGAGRGGLQRAGPALPQDPPEDASLKDLVRRGAALGALHRDRARLGYAAPDNPMMGALYPTAIQYGYGEIWFRPGLEQRPRALVAVAAFTASPRCVCPSRSRNSASPR